MGKSENQKRLNYSPDLTKMNLQTGTNFYVQYFSKIYFKHHSYTDHSGFQIRFRSAALNPWAHVLFSSRTNCCKVGFSTHKFCLSLAEVSPAKRCSDVILDPQNPSTNNLLKYMVIIYDNFTDQDSLIFVDKSLVCDKIHA